MGLFFNFSSYWWIIIAIIYLPYIVLFVQRKSYKKSSEVKVQIFMASVSLFFTIAIEYIGISYNLWTYVPTNWPIILWVAYFGSGLLAYQLTKKLEEMTKNKESS